MNTFYKLISTINKIVCATFLTLAYYSLFSFLNTNVTFYITVPVFAVSYIVIESIYLAAKRYYQPYLLIHGGETHTLKPEKYDSYYFEIAFVILIFSVILFISAYIPFILNNFFSGVTFSEVQAIFFETALYIFLSYTAALIGGYLLIVHKIGISNQPVKLALTFNGYVLAFCTAFSFILFLWYIIQSANVLL